MRIKNNSSWVINIDEINKIKQLIITDKDFVLKGLKKFLSIEKFHMTQAKAKETSTEFKVEGFISFLTFKDVQANLIVPKGMSSEKILLTVSMDSLTLKQLYSSNILLRSIDEAQLPDITFKNTTIKIFLKTQEIFMEGTGPTGPLSLGLTTPPFENSTLSISAKFVDEKMALWEAGIKSYMTLGQTKLKVMLLFPENALGWRLQLESTEKQFLEDGMDDLNTLLKDEKIFPKTILPPNIPFNNKPILKNLFMGFNYYTEVFTYLNFDIFYDNKWKVFDNDIVEVDNLEISFSYDSHSEPGKTPYFTYNGRIKAKARVFGVEEQIEIPLPPFEDTWSIRTLPPPGMISLGRFAERLESILGESHLLDTIPPEIKNLGDDFGLRYIELTLSPTSTKPLSVSASIGTTKKWTFPYLKEVSLDDIGLEFLIVPDVPISDTKVFGRVYGELNINNTVVSVFIQKLQGQTHWSMGLDLNEMKIGLPEVAELIGLNKESLVSYLPSSLSVIKDLKLMDFNIEYENTLKNTGFDIQLTEPWILWKDKVQVDKLSLSVNVQSPLQKSQRLQGRFLGDINLGNVVYLQISADNFTDGKDWVLTGRSNPSHTIHLTDLAKYFFEWLVKDHPWPSWVPQVVLKELSVSYQTGDAEALTFDAAVGITLKDIDQYLGDFFPYAELNAGLHITSDKSSDSQNARSLKGTLGGDVALGEHLKFGMAYDFRPDNHILHLMLGKQICKLQKGPEGTFLIADINNLSIGDVITSILQLVRPEKKLEFPFDILNSVKADHLTLKLNLTKRKSTLETTNLYKKSSMDDDLFAGLPDAELSDSPSTLRTIWIPIQSALGSLYFERIGFQSAGKSLRILFDASFSFSGLALELEGLSFGFPIKDPKEFDWSQLLGLDGIGVSFTRGPVQLLGALLKRQDPETPGITDYMGEISIKAHTLGFSALGAYASKDGCMPSACAFVSVNIPIGGPPYLSLKGLAGGFGVNRDLQLPTLAEIINYPLVKGAMGKEKSFNNSKPLDGLKALGKYLKPAFGRCWLAAGVKVSSMEMIEAFGLITVCLGTKIEVAFLGVGSVTLPKGASDPVFQAELALEAIFSLDQFLISFGGELTPSSFILSRDCHITGGFNFSIWFGPPHLGDFVITLGGFSPYFEVPKHYPNPPRLGLSWQFNENLIIKGGAYYALTPKCMMVGGGLELAWKSPGLNATFTAQMHFIISWLPYYFRGKIPIHITASYDLNAGGFVTKTITFNADALLDVWGPTFSGKAIINVYFLSFSFSFGQRRTPPEPISWEDFKTTFLPIIKSSPMQNALSKSTDEVEVGVSSVCTIRMASGVMKEFEGATNDNVSCIADPAVFSIIVSTVIPAKEAKVNSIHQNVQWKKDFGIGLVGVDQDILQSDLEISLTCPQYSQPQIKADYLSENMSAALWGEIGAAFDEKSPDLKTNLLSGFRLSSYLIPSDITVPVAVERLLYHTSDPIIVKEWSDVHAPTEDDFDQTQAFATIMRTLKDSQVITKREKLLQLLREQGLELTKDIHTPAINERAADVFAARPNLSYLGEEKLMTRTSNLATI